jgi:uncharacterized membrane protein
MTPSPTDTLTYPAVGRISITRPFTWLAQGWRDLWRQPTASLFYGAVAALFGIAILYTTLHLPYLFTAAVSGFLLVAPVLATGIYELSRRYEGNEPVRLIDSMLAWRRNTPPMLGLGIIAMLAGTAWQIVSVVILALYYEGGAMEPFAMILEVLRDPQYKLLFLAYVGTGGVIAALMFAASVVTMPMLLARRCDLADAMLTSFTAVAENPLPMALWATLIMALTAIGFATALLGLVIILPWLGHASWHAYRDLAP